MSGMETLVERAGERDEIAFTQSEQCSNEVLLKRVTKLAEPGVESMHCHELSQHCEKAN